MICEKGKVEYTFPTRELSRIFVQLAPERDSGQVELLPAGFENAGNGPIVSELTEANPRHLELTQIPTGSSCKRAPIAKADGRRITRQFVEFFLSCSSIFIARGHATYYFFEFLTLFPSAAYHLFASTLFCHECFCHNSFYFLRAGPFCRCFRLGSFLLIT